MSKFTKMWRVEHHEPLTYNERIVNSACDIIEELEGDVERHSAGRLQALELISRYDQSWAEEKRLLKKQIKQLKATKCPPISEGDSCICPIEELEALLEQLIFIAEKADTDDSEDSTIELAKQALKPRI